MNEEELTKLREDIVRIKEAILLLRKVVELQSERIDNLEDKRHLRHSHSRN